MKDNTARDVSLFESGDATTKKIPCRPFVKWVGGKSQILPELIKRVPKEINRYFEPFAGGGALYFALQPQQAYLSDSNAELMNAYTVVRDNVETLIAELGPHVYEKEYYYQLRNADRSPEFQYWSPAKRAARLIYLNKTCFNGLYRVNSRGHFNTPFGRYHNPTIVDANNLHACGQALKDVSICTAHFEHVEELLGPSDFVYFDPPYVPVSATANFTAYSLGGFDVQMQRRLYELCYRLDKRGVRFMLSNSSAAFVSELYSRFKIETISAVRAINSKADRRGAIPEVVISNFD